MIDKWPVPGDIIEYVWTDKWCTGPMKVLKSFSETDEDNEETIWWEIHVEYLGTNPYHFGPEWAFAPEDMKNIYLLSTTFIEDILT